MLDLTLTPVYDKSSGADVGMVQAETHQLFGHYNGTIKAGGRTLQIKNAFGWAEQHSGGW